MSPEGLACVQHSGCWEYSPIPVPVETQSVGQTSRETMVKRRVNAVMEKVYRILLERLKRTQLRLKGNRFQRRIPRGEL